MLRASKEVLNLEHYLDVQAKKPGALAGSTPLEQWRVQGKWPESFDQFWANLKQRRGKADGTRAMIDVLLLGWVLEPGKIANWIGSRRKTCTVCCSSTKTSAASPESVTPPARSIRVAMRRAAVGSSWEL